MARRRARVSSAPPMKAILLVAFPFAACASSGLLSSTPGAQGFDADTAGWRAASTGGRGPDATWTVHADATAISSPNVVSLTAANHGAEDRFNLWWSDAARLRDGRVAVAVRADAGVVDQGGGPMWRVQDANNYYVWRFNPLESNFRVYVVKDGVRKQLATALTEVKVGTWHRVEAEHVGDRITCWLDGEKLLTAVDGSIAAEGGVGLWTKADARTSFDDFAVTAVRR
jgi:hypothetical protein